MLTGKQPFTGSSPMEAMNDRLLNYPMPPSVADPAISPQLQEVLYRALERDPKNRYARARDFAHDLQHLDQVGVEERPEIHTGTSEIPITARYSVLFRNCADPRRDSAADDADCSSPIDPAGS